MSYLVTLNSFSLLWFFFIPRPFRLENVAFSLTRSVTWGLNSGHGKMRGPKAPRCERAGEEEKRGIREEWKRNTEASQQGKEWRAAEAITRCVSSVTSGARTIVSLHLNEKQMSSFCFFEGVLPWEQLHERIIPERNGCNLSERVGGISISYCWIFQLAYPDA